MESRKLCPSAFLRKGGGNNLHIEKLNVKFCKYLLGDDKKASNLAIRKELGRYPLYIDVVVLMIKYLMRLNDTKNKIADKLLFRIRIRIVYW